MKIAIISDVDLLVNFQNIVMEKIEDKSTWGMYSKQFLVDFFSKPTNIIELYYDSQALVGFLMLTLDDKEEFEDYNVNHTNLNKSAIYGGVMISPLYWGNGLQKQMTERLEYLAKKANRSYMVATVSPDNKYSYNNLINTGYKVIGEKNMEKGYRHIVVKEL